MVLPCGRGYSLLGFRGSLWGRRRRRGLGTLHALCIVELLREFYEGLRVRHQRLAYIRMRVEVVLKFGMILEVFWALNQGGILGELRSNIGMRAEKFSEVALRIVIPVSVTIAVIAIAAITIEIVATVRSIFPPIVTIFVPHEGVRILLQLLANFGMVLQIGLQGRVVLQELLIVGERRIFAELFGSFPVRIEELIKTGKLATLAVAILVARITDVLEAIFVSHERIRIILQRIASGRVVPQIGLQGGVIL